MDSCGGGPELVKLSTHLIDYVALVPEVGLELLAEVTGEEGPLGSRFRGNGEFGVILIFGGHRTF